MSEILPEQEVRIDRESKLILRTLRGRKWIRALKLRRAADLGENRQVFYRMENYLIPGGLVEERERESSKDLREFRLTPKGAEWVEENAEKLLAPTTREEMREYAFEGYKAGTSAQDSVQNYRKKLHRVKNRVDDIREEVGEIADQQDSDDTTLTILWERSEDNRDRSKRHGGEIEALQEDVETRATTDDLDGLRDDLSRVEHRLSTVEGVLDGVVRQQAHRERERARVARAAKPAGYVVVGALAAYVVVLGGVAFLAPELAASVILAGIVAALAVVVGIGAVVYARGANSGETSRVDRDVSSLETAD